MLRTVTLVFFLLLAANEGFAQSPKPTDFSKLYWLVGTWNRIHMKNNQQGHERWEKIAPGELKGWGVSMKGADTTVMEKLTLVLKEGQIFFVAETADNPQPVWFAVTRITANSFVCENPAHDFPKQIRYALQGKVIRASISGNGKSIDYVFEKAGNGSARR